MSWLAAYHGWQAYQGYRQAEKEYEREMQQIAIAKKEAQDEANARLIDYFNTQTSLNQQQKQINQAMSEEMSRVAIDVSSRISTLQVSLGEGNVGGNLEKRLQTSIKHKEVKEQGTIEANRRNLMNQTQQEKMAAFMAAAPPTVYYFEPEKPNLWEYVAGGALGAGAAESRRT